MHYSTLFAQDYVKFAVTENNDADDSTVTESSASEIEMPKAVLPKPEMPDQNEEQDEPPAKRAKSEHPVEAKEKQVRYRHDCVADPRAPRF